jgi:3-dehydroquinate synthase
LAFRWRKNGIDLGHIKNWVIKLPEMVIVDTEFLNTLPAEHLTSGICCKKCKHGINTVKLLGTVKNIDVSKNCL